MQGRHVIRMNGGISPTDTSNVQVMAYAPTATIEEKHVNQLFRDNGYKQSMSKELYPKKICSSFQFMISYKLRIKTRSTLKMSSYFPILPTITDSTLPESISSSTDFFNHTSNCKQSTLKNVEGKLTFLATYKHENDLWSLISVDECRRGSHYRLSRSSLGISDNQMLVSVAKFTNCFQSQTRYLPKPDSLSLDSSPVAERASLNYHFGNNSSSYQGEYPYQMSCLKKGSFWSFDALKEIESEISESFLILMNINHDAQANSEVDLEIYHPSSIEKKVHFRAGQNAYTILKLREVNHLHPKGDQSSPLFIQSKSSLFIPMFLNVNKITSQLSFEHTHPPSELLWGADKMQKVQSIKKRWL